nr:MAG TPA: hypothetical protein [Caudoviricetes sp.]
MIENIYNCKLNDRKYLSIQIIHERSRLRYVFCV